MLEGTFTCQDLCPEGFFGDKITNLCTKCDSKCSKCTTLTEC